MIDMMTITDMKINILKKETSKKIPNKEMWNILGIITITIEMKIEEITEERTEETTEERIEERTEERTEVRTEERTEERTKERIEITDKINNEAISMKIKNIDKSRTISNKIKTTDQKNHIMINTTKQIPEETETQEKKTIEIFEIIEIIIQTNKKITTTTNRNNEK